MAYKIMIDEDYETEGGITEIIPVEYDGITYETSTEAWNALWNSKDYDLIVGYHVYLKEI